MSIESPNHTQLTLTNVNRIIQSHTQLTLTNINKIIQSHTKLMKKRRKKYILILKKVMQTQTDPDGGMLLSLSLPSSVRLSLSLSFFALGQYCLRVCAALVSTGTVRGNHALPSLLMNFHSRLFKGLVRCRSGCIVPANE